MKDEMKYQTIPPFLLRFLSQFFYCDLSEKSLLIEQSINSKFLQKKGEYNILRKWPQKKHTLFLKKKEIKNYLCLKIDQLGFTASFKSVSSGFSTKIRESSSKLLVGLVFTGKQKKRESCARAIRNPKVFGILIKESSRILPYRVHRPVTIVVIRMRQKGKVSADLVLIT